MSLRKMLVATASATVILGVAATTVIAATGDTDDHFSVAGGTTITGALKTGTKMILSGTINGIPITVNCTTFTATGKAPAKGLSVAIAPPTIKGCTDTLGGKDTVITNQTNGKWKVAEVDAPNDESATEPNPTGDKLKLTIPKAGATFSSSLVPGCTITAAPTVASSVSGTYDDTSTGKVTNSPIPVSATGCSATTATVSATVILSPGVHDVS